MTEMSEQKTSGTRTFMFVVYVLFGVLAAVVAFLGVAMLISGMPGAGLIALVIAAVLTFMSVSVKKSLREISE